MTHDDELIERARTLLHPLAPLPTGVEPVLRRLPDIKAVLFDVYGTLLVSASGDVGTTRGAELLAAPIKAEHERLRAEGVDHPEVDIRGLWRRLLPDEDDIDRRAVEFECSANPVWPMPGAAETLAALERRGIATGVVSNAQFYTPLLFRALLGRPPPEPAVWSFEYGIAKPSQSLFLIALDELERRRGIPPDAVLYIGNDMAKDIRPAAALGCRTVLFAGDRRSYRPHDWQPPAVPPDAVVTELVQLKAVLGMSPA